MITPSKVIITGQQIGLLGGPLLTTYKLLSALALSSLSSSASTTYAAYAPPRVIYWLEDNDSDFQEINKISYLNKTNQLKTLTWQKKTDGIPIGKVAVDETLIELLQYFFSDLPQTSNTAPLKKLALGIYLKGTLLKDASLMLAQKLFEPYPITYFLPSNKAFLDFIKPYLLKESLKTQEGDQGFFFALLNGRRQAVFKRKELFYTRAGQKIEIANHILLPKLETRSVLQDAYFKSTTIIAGPNECQYLAGLDAQYEYHQVAKPEVKRRLSWLLLDKILQRKMKILALDWNDFLEHPQDILQQRFIEKKIGNALLTKKKSALSLNHRYVKELTSLLDFLPKNFIDSPLQGQTLNKEIKALEKYLYQNSKMLLGQQRKHLKQHFAQELNDIACISNELNPYGKTQERIFNLFCYLNRYGFEWMKKLYRQSMIELTKNNLDDIKIFYL